MRRKLLRLVDRSLGQLIALCIVVYDRILRPSAKRSRTDLTLEPAPKNILIIKMVGIGDTVLMLTPIQCLRRHFPDAKISALVTSLSSGIVIGQPSIDEVIVYNDLTWERGVLGFARLIRLLRNKRFDCVMDFEQHFRLTSVLAYLTGASRRIGFYYNRSLRGSLYTDSIHLDSDCNMVDSYMNLLRPLGIDSPPVDTLEGIHIGADDEAKVARWLANRGICSTDLVIGIHAGSGPRAPHKRWDKENFAEIIRRLQVNWGAKVILTGTTQERGLIQQIMSLVGDRTAYDSGGEFDTKQVAALAKRCDLFLSNDTGPMHIAAAVGTPTIGLFGPESPCRYAPVGKRNASIYKQLSCSPCVEIHKGKVRDCDNPVCMREISVEDVWTRILGYDLKGSRQ